MVKSNNAKKRNIEKKNRARRERKPDPNRGIDGCARIKALHQREPEPEPKQSFMAKLRFWK